MRLAGQVASDDLGALAPGRTVRFAVRGYGDQKFEGAIERISPAADPVTRQIPLIVEIPNPAGKLVAGLYAEGRVAAEQREALILPLGAVDTSRDQPSVLRVRDGLLERVTIALGIRDDRAEVAEVKSGLVEGDVVVMTRAATTLRAGQQVELGKPRAAQAPPPVER
jgi:multidrug efflux pump subunit AcrA (membrane-fusion protein)